MPSHARRSARLCGRPERASRGGGKAKTGSRNRDSARRSRETRAQKHAWLVSVGHAENHAVRRLRALLEESGVTSARSGEVVAEARAAARERFRPHQPPSRSAGGRTQTTDEELEAAARAGSADADRKLKNRQSARATRQRQWDEFNEATLEALCARAAVDALRAQLGWCAMHPLRLPAPTTPKLSQDQGFDPALVPPPSAVAAAATLPTGGDPYRDAVGTVDPAEIRAPDDDHSDTASVASSRRRSPAQPSLPASPGESRSDPDDLSVAGSEDRVAPLHPGALALPAPASAPFPFFVASTVDLADGRSHFDEEMDVEGEARTRPAPLRTPARLTSLGFAFDLDVEPGELEAAPLSPVAGGKRGREEEEDELALWGPSTVRTAPASSWPLDGDDEDELDASEAVAPRVTHAAPITPCAPLDPLDEDEFDEFAAFFGFPAAHDPCTPLPSPRVDAPDTLPPVHTFLS